MEVYQIGSSINNTKNAKDLDLIIVCDKPVDICVYTDKQWLEFNKNGGSDKGRRIVMFPRSHKGNLLNSDIKRLL